MADSSLTPNMSLPVPTVGEAGGPLYAQLIDNCLTIIDAHDHTAGSGVQITPDAMNINADLSMGGNNLTSARSLRLSPQSAVLVGSSDLGCLYEVGVDLYYNDGNGNNVRITQSGAVAGTPGSISNLTSPASASYATATFTFQSDALTPANIDGGSFILRNITASSNGITLSPPGSLSSNYTITLPALPASTQPLSIDTSGNMSAAPLTMSQLATSVTEKFTTSPTVQRFITGSGTYTRPSSPTPLYLRVTMVGAGGGGGGAVPGFTGSAGTDTTFGTLTAGGGAGCGTNGSAGSSGGAGGTATAVGYTGLIFAGSHGQGGGGGASFIQGGQGGANMLGGAGYGGAGNTAGGAGVANTGAGGGGSGNVNAGFGSAGGGGSGAFISVVIPNPSATYSYSVGVGGSPGNGGGTGADGMILVEEFYS